jgi:MFS family permease
VSALFSHAALAPFQVRSYRFQWPADLLTSWASEMEALILGWYVMVETGSVLLLTLLGSLQYFGTLVAPLFGVVGDRIGHRNLLCAMRAVYCVLAVAMMALALAGLITPVFVLVIAALSGTVRPSDQVMRNSLIGALMPADALVSAMSVSRTTMDTARIAGALAGAGVFAALGMGLAYLVIASLYAASFVLTLGIAGTARVTATGIQAGAAVRRTHWGDLREGIAYVWTTPAAVSAMALAFLVNLTAFPLSNGLLPYVARDIYRVDQAGLGYLVASFACGSLIGSLALTIGGRGIRPARMMIVSIAIWYALLLVFANLGSAAGGLPVLLCAGLAQSLGMVPMSVMLLRTADEQFRGRVMGVRMLAVYGLPLGLLGAGTLIGRIGFVATANCYCFAGLALTLAIAVHWRADLWRATAPANLR